MAVGTSNSRSGSPAPPSRPTTPPPVILGGMTSQDLARLVSSTVALALGQVARATPPPPAAPPVPAPAPPVTATHVINSGTSRLPIPDRFPHVDESVCHEIASHSFSPRDLWKLDERYSHSADKKRLFDLETGKLTESQAPRSYPSLSYLLLPLEKYFSILTSYLAGHNSGEAIASIQGYFADFRCDLIRLNDEYAWSAVTAYFTAFFLERRTEMKYGDYEGWRRIDSTLQNRYLVGHPKPVPSSGAPKAKGGASLPAARKSEICFAYNTTKGCANPCKDERVHGCRNCYNNGVQPAPHHSAVSPACPFYTPLASAPAAAR